MLFARKPGSTSCFRLQQIGNAVRKLKTGIDKIRSNDYKRAAIKAARWIKQTTWSSLGRRVATIAVIVFLALLGGLIEWVFDTGARMRQGLHWDLFRELFPHGALLAPISGFFWVMVAVAFAIRSYILTQRRDHFPRFEAWWIKKRDALRPAVNDPYGYERRWNEKIKRYKSILRPAFTKKIKRSFRAAIVILVLAIASPVAIGHITGGLSYSGGTTVVVESLDATPSMLRPLMERATRTSAGEAQASVVGFNTRIIEQPIELNWETRPASAPGARQVIKANGDTDSNSMLLDDTIMFRSDGKWSAIRDGLNGQHIVGVSEWDGVSARINTCRFDGVNELNYAFQGLWGRNLADLVAARYPDNQYEPSDMWGYCDNGTPTIVIPTYRKEGFLLGVTRRPAGVLTIKGSPNGEPIMDLVTDVETGRFSGPVYPSTLAKEQRNAFDNAAGIDKNLVLGFGTEPSSVESQKSNPSEYLLKSVKDGRLYWVTPVRPNKGDSQRIIGYFVIPADEAKIGSLNANTAYFFADNDRRTVDLQAMYANATNAINVQQPSFFSPVKGKDGKDVEGSAGKLTEFLPTGEDRWQIFAERDGRVYYRVDMTTNQGIASQVVTLEQQQEQSSESGLNCPTKSDEMAKLTPAQLKQCADAFTGALQERAEKR